MGLTRDLNVVPGGIGALLSMNTIIKTSMHRHAMHKCAHTHTHTCPFLSFTLANLLHSHTKMMKVVMIGFALVNPNDTGLPPFLSFSNNVGLT